MEIEKNLYKENNNNNNNNKNSLSCQKVEVVLLSSEPLLLICAVNYVV